MYKHDRQWLEAVLPKPKRWGPKVDWTERDERQAARVDIVKASLIASQKDKTFRISRKRIARELGIDARSLGGRLPKVNQAIRAAAETPEQYKIRKLYWLIGRPEPMVPRTFNALLLLAEIRIESRLDPSIAEAIKGAAELYEQRPKEHIASTRSTAA